MIICNLMGGLGNQIFQIFATISYAIKSKQKFNLLNVKQLGSGKTTIRYTFWDTFFSNLKPFLINEMPSNINIIKEQNFEYNELPAMKLVYSDILLYGYFQSYKYFEENYTTICKLIGIEKMKNKLIEKLQINSIFLNNTILNNTISMHFRIGDYKNIQHVHPLSTYEYYKSALTYIQNKESNKFNIIYFCENDDIDDVLTIVNQLIQDFPNFTFTKVDSSLDDWEQMLLMSCCYHNIIANSSFSWWGAYFNSNKDKIVCYPSKWFGDSVNNNTKDLCPETWVHLFPPLEKVEPNQL